jgi:hypothetical protein
VSSLASRRSRALVRFLCSHREQALILLTPATLAAQALGPAVSTLPRQRIGQPVRDIAGPIRHGGAPARSLLRNAK